MTPEEEVEKALVQVSHSMNREVNLLISKCGVKLRLGPPDHYPPCPLCIAKGAEAWSCVYPEIFTPAPAGYDR